MFLSELREFPSVPCLAGEKKNLITPRISMLLKSRTSLICFRACFFPGRAKDLSAPRYMFIRVFRFVGSYKNPSSSMSTFSSYSLVFSIESRINIILRIDLRILKSFSLNSPCGTVDKPRYEQGNYSFYS